MGLLHYLWSRTAASNATADAQINWAEGMAPSAVNDSARAMMASLAGYRDDISGAIATGGTSTAYTVTSYQVFDTLAHMNGHVIAFTPHTTNGATVTLNVDGLGAKPLRSSTGVELVAGVLVAGTPYTALYNNSDAVWYLHNFYVNPYVVPIGGMIDYTASTAPNSAFVLPYGQAISRTTYSAYFALVSTTYGVGDGSTTFNVPDLRGRLIAGKDDMGGSAASRLTSTSISGGATTLGAVGGGETATLAANQIPTLTGISGTNSISVTSTNYLLGNTTTNSGSAVGGGTQLTASDVGSGAVIIRQPSSGSNVITVGYTNASQSNVPLTQPTIILNKILRII